MTGAGVAQPLPPVPVPEENPITEPKRVLGKILFWDAQLSSDNSVACGTCHRAASGGVDPRLGRNPGFDGSYDTDDDVFGSPGVIRAAPDGAFTPDAVFGLAPQVTGRAANASIMAAFAGDVFWDGRARSVFVDPESGETVIAEGGGLESQAVGPIVSPVEMAHEGRDWSEVAAKLAAVRPLALAAELPPDMAAAVGSETTYPALFAAAFGTAEITAARIAMAIATYERTIVPDETPWDRFIDGDRDAMTESQQFGWLVFRASDCIICHREPFFTDHTFRNVGLRPIEEDRGRQDVTNDPADRGRFKVPSLRNVGLRPRFMHNGRIGTIENVFDFYARRNGFESFPENRDEILDVPLSFDEGTEAQIIDFLVNGLTDPRAAEEAFPFDRPTLHTELPGNPLVVAAGTPGSGGLVPVMIAPGPPNLGNGSFRFGIGGALGGAAASLSIHRTLADAESDADAVETLGPFALAGAGAGNGYGTAAWPLADEPALLGDEAYAVWRVSDPEGKGGTARSPVVRLTFYRVDPTSCGCAGDLNCDGLVGIADLLGLLARWGPCALCGADLDDDGDVDLQDLIALLARWGGC